MVFNEQILNGTTSNKTLGVQILESRGLFAESNWVWIGVGALIGYILVFNAVYTVALTFLDRKYPQFYTQMRLTVVIEKFSS